MKKIDLIILLAFSISLSYFLSIYFYFNIRTKKLLFNKKFNFNKYISKYNNPYNLNPKILFYTKYIFSSLFFLISLIQIKDIFLSIILFILLFFIPNILIFIKRKKQNIKNLNNLKIFVSNLNLSLYSNISLYQSLEISNSYLKQNNFKDVMNKFIYNYKMSNFNIDRAINSIYEEITFIEGKMFLDILLNSSKEGNLIQSLDVFYETLNLSYFKILKFKESKRMMYVIISGLIGMINIIIITMYPIITEIIQNLEVILM